jgi:hypothetical protein
MPESVVFVWGSFIGFWGFGFLGGFFRVGQANARLHCVFHCVNCCHCRFWVVHKCIRILLDVYLSPNSSLLQKR